METDNFTNVIVQDIAASQKNALVGGPFGSNLITSDYVEAGIPVIRGQNMGQGRWVTGSFAFVTREKAQSLKANMAKPGDLVFTQRGTLGQVAIIPTGEFPEYLISQSQMKLTVDEQKADAVYLFYVFSGEEQLAYIRQNSIQTGVPHTNLTTLRNTPLTLPKLNEQKAIAKILSSLDDKIELNRQMNATLEAMARALFKAWFVDFEPVDANLQNRPSTSASPEIAKLFPSDFENGIPRGWGKKSLDEIADFLNGLALQKFPPESEYEFLSVIKIAQLRKGNTEGSDKASKYLKPEYIVRDGDVLFSWSGSLEVEIWCGGDGALNQHLFKVTSQNYPKWFYFLWTRFHLADFRETAAHKATTMGHIQRYHLKDAKVTVPDPQLLAEMNRVFEPIIVRLTSNNIEAKTLAEIRDSLLSRLLNGSLKSVCLPI